MNEDKKEMDEFFFKEEHCPIIFEDKDFDLAVTGVGHCRVPHGPILDEVVSTYALVAWCIEGEVETFCDDVSYCFKTSEVLIIPYNITYHTVVRSDFAEIIYFALEGKKAWATLLELKLWEGVFYGGNVSTNRFYYLLENISSTDPKSIWVNTSFAIDTLTCIAKNHRVAAEDKLALNIEILIRQEWNNPELDVNYILNKLGFHRTTVSSKFKKRTGMSIVDYINNVRLTEAKRMLLNTALPIKLIAQECGFADPHYFSRLFNKKEKINPNQFRSTVREKS